MAVKTLRIALEPGEEGGGGGYSAGRELRGQVLLVLVGGLRVRAVRLQARGAARLFCGGSQSPAEQTEYLNLQHTLREAPAGESFLTLPAGKHEFPFCLQLPQGPLVTSFTGKYGHIRYCLIAVVEQPSAPPFSVRREFKVVSHIDVNSPALLTPVLRSQEKMIGCCFFTSGPISLSAKIERKGYCSDKVIPIYAEIENCSSRLIVPKAAIFQTQTFLCHGKTRTCRQMLANVRGNHIASGSADTWNGKTLKIPPVIPSILDCSIIKVEYSLAVYIHIPGANKLMIELPLVIGTIPYNGFASRNCSVASQFSLDMSWLALALPEHPEVR
ncbi:arrestin domain-containing protein 4 [Microcaecilia unicolor]|uniref:Arrestin domain-containing protein 4 n=1 Tax=Microcaecilia unicolor TaxID=1415580 RepID=A0A6P7X7X3_9AMPH|nr:arrestin domain-containing protein 4 [Microcaecilia unicolor]